MKRALKPCVDLKLLSRIFMQTFPLLKSPAPMIFPFERCKDGSSVIEQAVYSVSRGEPEMIVVGGDYDLS
jgi:hypothetical protein